MNDPAGAAQLVVPRAAFARCRQQRSIATTSSVIGRWTPRDAVYAAIYEVTAYRAWWPEVKEARKLDEQHLWMCTRSILPYDLAFDLERTIAEPRAGILEARLAGEQVVTNKAALNALAPIVRPAFLAGFALGRGHEPPD